MIAMTWNIFKEKFPQLSIPPAKCALFDLKVILCYWAVYHIKNH